MGRPLWKANFLLFNSDHFEMNPIESIGIASDRQYCIMKTKVMNTNRGFVQCEKATNLFPLTLWDYSHYIGTIQE